MPAGDAERGRRIGAGALGVVAAVGIGHAVLTRGPERVSAGPVSGEQSLQVDAVERGDVGGVVAQPAAGGSLIDLNSASVAELDLLPGIGPALAGRIVAHRDEHGAFASVEALDDVHGIGPRTVERVRAMVTVGD